MVYTTGHARFNTSKNFQESMLIYSIFIMDNLEEKFFKRWNTEEYPNVNKTSNYNISDKENAPSPLAIDVLELNEDNTLCLFYLTIKVKF